MNVCWCIYPAVKSNQIKSNLDKADVFVMCVHHWIDASAGPIAHSKTRNNPMPSKLDVLGVCFIRSFSCHLVLEN